MGRHLQCRPARIPGNLGRLQISPSQPQPLALAELAEKLRAAGQAQSNGLLLQFKSGDHDLIIFPDGRAIVRGTNDLAFARTLYARYIGG